MPAVPAHGLTVGVVGLGIIGGGIGRALVRAGTTLVVHDVREEAIAPFRPAARVAPSPADVAAGADVVIVAVFSEDQVRTVFAGPAGLLERPRPGLTVITVSTISVQLLEELSAQAARAGVRLIDTGVTGGRVSAAEGRLICMVGGSESDVERVRPVLEAFSTLVVRTGPPGSGIRAKLARNLITYVSYHATAAAMELAGRAGVDLDALAQAVRISDGQTGGPATQQFARRGAAAAVRTHQAAACRKDLGAALALARSLGLELPLAELTLRHVGDLYDLDEGPRPR